MSPRISVVRNGVRDELKGVEAEARRSELVAGFCWAALGKAVRETAKQQHAKWIREKEIIMIPLGATIYPFSRQREGALPPRWLGNEP